MELKISFSKIHCWAILFSFLNAIAIQAQSGKADSLLDLVKNAPNDTSRWNALKDLAIYYQETQPELGLKYSYQELELGKKLGEVQTLKSMIDLANFYSRMSKLDSVKILMEDVIKRSGHIEDKTWEGKAFITLGGVYEKYGELAKAIESYQRAMSLVNTRRDSIILMNNLGLAYFRSGQFDPSLAIYLKGLDLAKKDSLYRIQAVILGNMSMDYEEMGKYDEGIKLVEEAIEIKKRIKDKRGLLYSYDRLGSLQVREEKNWENGIATMTQQFELSSEARDTYFMVRSQTTLGEIRLKQKNIESAQNYLLTSLSLNPPGREDLMESRSNTLNMLAQIENEVGNYGKALGYLKESLRTVPQELGFWNPYKQKNLAIAYIGLGMTEEAMDAFQEYSSLMDSVYRAERFEKVAEIDAKYQTAEKEKAIALLEKDKAVKEAEIERSKSQVAIVSLGALLLLVFGGAFYFRYRYQQRLKLEQMRTRIASDLHDEVGSSLSHLNLLIGSFDVENSPDRTAKAAEKTKEIMARTASNIRDVVWAIDARRDKAGDLFDRMEDFAYDMLTARNISYHFNREGVRRELVMNPFVRQNIYLIYKESINNIAKHSNATEVNISLRQTDSRLEMTIADNGTPTNGSKVKGQGLDNMRLRAERIGGEVDIQQTEQGFLVKLSTPITGR
ncbi:MAG: tetratricopeptide repeat protein [Bacteroidetes bacterium]|nr:tetratricopeptide repeat protein [Bacteroidota bacterium]